MTEENLASVARAHLEALCAAVPDRRPGSAGNVAATAYVAEAMRTRGWTTAEPEFDCLDWETSGGTAVVGPRSVALTPSPYGLGVTAAAPIRVLRTAADLERPDLEGTIVVLTGALTSEPLTPKSALSEHWPL